MNFPFGLGFKCTKARATREVLQRFCTKYNDPPRYYAGPKPEFNEGLFDKVRKRVEIILTDAAANELLASNVTRGARDPNIEGPRCTDPSSMPEAGCKRSRACISPRDSKAFQSHRPFVCADGRTCLGRKFASENHRWFVHLQAMV